MNPKVRTLLIVLGVIAVSAAVAYYPYPGLYDGVIEAGLKAPRMDVKWPPPQDFYPCFTQVELWRSILFRLIATIIGQVITAGLIIVMVFLRRACAGLKLDFFRRLLAVAIFYAGIMTVIMLTGIWLDFYVLKWHDAILVRVGYVFNRFILY